MDQIRELTFGSRGLWFFVSHFHFAADVAGNLAEILNSTPFLAKGKTKAFASLSQHPRGRGWLGWLRRILQGPTALDAAALKEVFTEYAAATDRRSIKHEKAMTFLFRDVLGGNFDVRHPPNLEEKRVST